MKKVMRSFLTMSTVLALMVPAMYAHAESADSVTPPEGYTPEKLSKKKIANIAEADGEAGKALLVLNVNPWSSDAAQDTLADLGIAYDIVTMDLVDDRDLSQYRMIMLANDQNASFYSDYNDVKDELEAYVNAGGSVLFGVADQGWNFGYLDSSLPGGVTTTTNYEDNNTIVDSDHPVVTGQLTDGSALTNSQLNGNFASHRYVNESSLPAASNVILRGASTGQATLVEYELGQGLVIASGLTWEIARDFGWSYSHAYDDLVKYAYNSSNIDDQPDYLAIATQLVEQAEVSQTQASVDAAQTAINNVPDGEEKTALQARLDAVKKAIQDITTASGYLQDILNARLTSKTGIDAAIDKLNQAKKLYQGLPEGNGKDALGQDIDEAQDVIEDAILAILQTTVSGKPYTLTGKQMTIMILHAIDQVEANSQDDIDEVMAYLMPLVQGHTNLSESWIRGMVQLYLPQSQPV